MTELIADLPYRVVDAAGGEYYASVAGEQRADGVWDGWLEFVPTDESDAFVTDVETTQSTRADLVRWADAVTGKTGLRARLVALPRATLLAIIGAFGLNPARKSLAWLSQPQLITFIATATEVQVTSGTRAD